MGPRKKKYIRHSNMSFLIKNYSNAHKKRTYLRYRYLQNKLYTNQQKPKKRYANLSHKLITRNSGERLHHCCRSSQNQMKKITVEYNKLINQC